MERRKPKIQLGRRKTDTPAALLEQFKKDMTSHLRQTIEGVVNNPESGFRKDFNDYVQGDMAWKVRAEPVVKAFENTGWAFRVFVSSIKIISVLAGAVGAIGAAYFAVSRFINRP